VRRDLVADIEATKNNTGMTVVLAVSYGARAEITEAARAIARECCSGRLEPDAVDESVVGRHLSTAGIPDPDLLIRTSGEMRISNFFLWQIAYSEIYVTETLWPDFREQEFLHALREYQQRERRFGRVLDSMNRERLRAAR
jgi:undecaprenyl diphosphate synthase